MSLVAQTDMQFDLRGARGELTATLMAPLADFERDLLREKIRPSQRVKADRYTLNGLKPSAKASLMSEVVP